MPCELSRSRSAVGLTAFRMIAGSTCETINLLMLYRHDRHVWGSKQQKWLMLTKSYDQAMGFIQLLFCQILSRQNHRSSASKRTSWLTDVVFFPDDLMRLRVHSRRLRKPQTEVRGTTPSHEAFSSLEIFKGCQSQNRNIHRNHRISSGNPYIWL